MVRAIGYVEMTGGHIFGECEVNARLFCRISNIRGVNQPPPLVWGCGELTVARYGPKTDGVLEGL